MGEDENFGYKDILHQSRYLMETSRPIKDNFIFIADRIEVKRNKSSLVDVGCCNGAFLAYLKNHRDWNSEQLCGMDISREYIDFAQTFGDLQGVNMLCDSFFGYEERKWDIVVTIGMIHGFSDFEEAFDALANLCNPGGTILCEALINEEPIDIQCKFCDNSHPSTEGKWVNALNRFSRKRVEDYLKPRFASYDFLPVPINTDLPKYPEFPRRAHTVKTEDGERLIVKWGQLHNSVLVVANKK